MELLYLPTLLLLLAAAAATNTTNLDPKQVRALQSLGLPTTKNPCNTPQLNCDTSTPRHILSLTLTNCSDDITLSTTALKYLSNLQDLNLINCPFVSAPIHFPPHLSTSLKTFTCISSLRHLTGIWLSHLHNLTLLTISNTPINSINGPTIILSPLKYLQSITLSNTSLTGYLPKSWHQHNNITHLDLSLNQIRGKIPSSITTLENLVSLNLSYNQLSGEMPTSIGDLIMLTNLSFASNSLSGSIPESLAAVFSLVHLDLSFNKLNGSIPGFLADIKELKYLNLESNNFQGVLPFNASFITKLEVFKIAQNPNLCYNHSTVESKMKIGIAPCDKYGLPMSPPAKSVDSGGSDVSDYNDSSDDDKEQIHHDGPNKVVLGVAIALSSIIFLIIFLILLSKWCA